jgi:hypothetical protein
MSETPIERSETTSELEAIDGGLVQPIEDLPFAEQKHRAETARKMAFLLVWIMAGSVGVHFVGTAAFSAYDKTAAVEALGKIFNMWLPVISGLASGAATYYFAKENQR